MQVFCFTVFICGGGIQGITKHDSESITAEISQLYATTDYGRRAWINLYGLTQRAMGKDVIENFTLCKNSYGKIVCPRACLEQNKAVNAVENIKELYCYLEKENIPAYYITSLLPIDEKESLPWGIEDYSHNNSEKVEKLVSGANIPIIDLRMSEEILKIPNKSRFYLTDHHWRLETCFAAYVEIMKQIEDDLGWNLTNDRYILGLENYNKYVRKKVFLGSYGVKMGEWYTEMDDFVCFMPNWDTDFWFGAYQNNELVLEKEGNFTQALMDMECIEDEDYYNKYMAFSNVAISSAANIESRVINNKSINDYKLLLISHSYGRPLTQYFALGFKEVRNLDPQEGRYNENYLQYIEEYEPDIVLILVEFEGEIPVVIRTE